MWPGCRLGGLGTAGLGEQQGDLGQHWRGQIGPPVQQPGQQPRGRHAFAGGEQQPGEIQMRLFVAGVVRDHALQQGDALLAPAGAHQGQGLGVAGLGMDAKDVGAHW